MSMQQHFIRTLRFSILTGIAVMFFALFPFGFAHAASIELATSEPTVGEGSEIEVSVLLTTEELVNAVEVAVRIPEMFEYVGVSDGSSVINFWVEQPTYVNGTRVVSFSGIVPGGFIGARAKLLDIRLRAPRAGRGEIILTERSSVFVHGPDGVRSRVHSTPLSIVVVRGLPAQTLSVNDTTPPEAFVPTLSTDPALFDGRLFVTFATQDKGSGIARYEIQERSIDMPIAGAWRVVESPALLDDATRNSYVFVRAIDRAGNERVAIIRPLREDSFLASIFGLLCTVLALFFLISLYNRVHRYARGTRTE